MTRLLDWVLASLSVNNDAWLRAFLALAYIVLKIFAKGMVKFVCESRYDYFDTLSWFAVDLSVLTLVLSTGASFRDTVAPADLRVWYPLIVSVLIFSLLLYAVYVRFAEKRKFLARAAVAVNLFLAYPPFWKLLNTFR